MKIVEANLLFGSFTMNKKRLLLIASFLCSSYTFSQDISLNVLSTQGGFDTTSSMTLAWTLGEPFVETVENNSYILTQGFHQPLFNSPTLNTNQTPEGFKYVVWPNPVSYKLNIHLNSTEDSRLNLKLFEISGRFIKQSSVNSMDSNISINVSNLSSGIYILKISSLNSSLIETHKIIKH